MKKLLLIAAILIMTIKSFSQSYNPSLHTVSNKGYGVAQASPTDARSKYYDAANFVYRAYSSTGEVLAYLNLSKYREGQFDIIVNSGGSLSGGVITGGTNAVYWFKNGTANGDLVLKNTVHSVNGQVGTVIAKNADSLKNLPVDTSARRHNWLLAFDSTNRKWYLVAGATGTALTEGTGIIIASGVISARNTEALWNASQLRGRSLSSATPVAGNIMKWSGSSWDYSADISGIDSAQLLSDSLLLFVQGDTVIVGDVASQTWVTEQIANIPLNPTVSTDETMNGDGSPGNPLGSDTVEFIATKDEINELHRRIDSIDIIPGGIDTVAHDNSLIGQGLDGNELKVDSAIFATQSWVTLTFTTPDGTETKIINSPTLSWTGTGSTPDPYIGTVVGSPSANPFRALSIYDYSGLANAVIPGSGSNATGTNQSANLEAMITASGTGQWIVVPNGEWLFSTAIAAITTKRIQLLILGNTYHNQADFLTISNATGAFRQHRVIHLGIAFGRVNMPSHSKSGATRSSPPWSTFAGTFLTISNTNQVYVEFNKIEGFKNGIELLGSGGNGAQENVIKGGWIYKCANAISLRSIDGSSFVDKNEFFIARLSGGLALKIDGFATPVGGEAYNGAFRSNKFHFLIEQVDSIAVCNGDITEPLFDWTIEGGVNTGVFGTDPIKMRSITPNYVRSPKYVGQGYMDAGRMGTGSTGSMGRGGSISMAIWSSGGNVKYGDYAKIQEDGTIVVYCEADINQATRSAAPGYVKFLNFGEYEKDAIVVAATYTPSAKERYIYYTHAAGTLTMPSPTAYPTREITVVNQHATADLTIANLAPGFATALSGRKAITYRSNGVLWYPSSDAVDFPLALSNINGTGNQGDIVSTDGTAAGLTLQPNHGGYTVVSVTHASSIPATLATVTVPDATAGEIEVILVGYSGGDLYKEHSLHSYSKTGGTLIVKGSETMLSTYGSDFTPAVSVGGVFVSNTFIIRVASSVAAESVRWTVYYIVRPTIPSGA